MSDLIVRLRTRAEIRRQISSRKSVQEGKPDRIADLLDEAASELQRLQKYDPAIHRDSDAHEKYNEDQEAKSEAKAINSDAHKRYSVDLEAKAKARARQMDYVLRSSKELCDKVQQSDIYAQNLYAAMCNMTWQSREFWQELKGETWSSTWRSAGGIVAGMRGYGSYIDWYCSGIGNKEKGFGLKCYIPTPDSDGRDFVSEGSVTEEIELDLARLGWRPIPYSDDK